jgi:tripartite-type tricarboxylate transporter receptor subunit TctC
MSKTEMKRMPVFPSVLLLLSAANFVFAQEVYPSRPIRLVVPFPAGGAVDIMARDLGQRITEAWRQQVVIDDRGGANGAIGSELVAKAKPDGYSLLMGSAGTHAINPRLYAKLPYDAVKDFIAVALVANLTNVLVIHPSLPAKTVKELIALAKSKPGVLTYASSGNGSSQHLSTELFKSMTGTDLTHVQYKGAGPALTDVIGGQISLTITAMSATLPYIQSGRLRVLGVTTAKRSPTLPQVPTIAEAGVRGYESNNWVGVFAPVATPVDIVTKLNNEIMRIQDTLEMRSRLETLGAEFAPNTPEQFGAFQRAEIAKWAKVIKESGARID